MNFFFKQITAAIVEQFSYATYVMTHIDNMKTGIHIYIYLNAVYSSQNHIMWKKGI